MELVELATELEPTATTDESGRCTLTANAGEELRLSVRHEAYAPYTSAPLRIPVSGALEQRVAMLVGGTVELRGSDADGAAPAAKLQVERRGPDPEISTRTTDAAGRAVFEHLVPGPHRFRVSRSVADASTLFGFGGPDDDE